MRKKIFINSSVVFTALVLYANPAAFGVTIEVVSQSGNTTVIVGGYDQVPGSLALPGPVTGPEFGIEPPPLDNPIYEVIQWVNAASPLLDPDDAGSGVNPANEWFYTGNPSGAFDNWEGDVGGGTYDGAMDGSNPLINPGLNTSDSMWLLKEGNSVWCEITVESDYVAFSMKPDGNDGISNFYVDDILVVTIDMYSEDDKGYTVLRTPETWEANELYLPIVIIVDVREFEPLSDIDAYHVLRVDTISVSDNGHEWSNDAEIFGGAALREIPEPGSMLLIWICSLLFLRRKKN